MMTKRHLKTTKRMTNKPKTQTNAVHLKATNIKTLKSHPRKNRMTKSGQTVMTRSAGQSENQRVDHGHAAAAAVLARAPAAGHVEDAADGRARGTGTRGAGGAASVILRMLSVS